MYSTILLYMYEARACAHKQFKFKAKLTRRPAYTQSKSRSIPPDSLSSSPSMDLSGSILVPPVCLFLLSSPLCFSFISPHLLSPSLCCRLLSSTFFISVSLSLPDLSSVKSSLHLISHFLMGAGLERGRRESERERGRVVFTEENPPARVRKD